MRLFKVTATPKKQHQNPITLYYFNEQVAQFKAAWYLSLPECSGAVVSLVQTEDEPSDT